MFSILLYHPFSCYIFYCTNLCVWKSNCNAQKWRAMVPGLSWKCPSRYVSKCRTRQYFENFTCFLPKISVGVSIPMTECLVSGTGTRGNMKSRGNVGDEAVWRIAVFLAKHEKWIGKPQNTSIAEPVSGEVTIWGCFTPLVLVYKYNTLNNEGFWVVTCNCSCNLPCLTIRDAYCSVEEHIQKFL